MSKSKTLIALSGLIWLNGYAINTTPTCQIATTPIVSRPNQLYAGKPLDFYVSGFKQPYIVLATNQCLASQEPGVYTTTLILKKDGNLVNYVYDQQQDLTYQAFASNTSALGIEYAVFYLDSNSIFDSVMVELLNSGFQMVQTVKPVATNYFNAQAKGSLELASIYNTSAPLVIGLAVYDHSNSRLYQYPYLAKPVTYLDVYFERHTLETRDAQYQITILDKSRAPKKAMEYSCQLPLTSTDCYGKVKLVESNHYIIYLEDSSDIQLAKRSQTTQSSRAIYINATQAVYFGWSNSDPYAMIDLNRTSGQTEQDTYNWIPLRQQHASQLHLFGWNDSPSLPQGSYQDSCDMSTMEFSHGILCGTCHYTDKFGNFQQISSCLNYDQECTSDPLQNDLVTTSNGILSCEK